MLGSTPVPLQAIIWPLAGAAIILALTRILPNWLRRLTACAASLASLAVLWSLRGAAVQRVEIPWVPLNLFRMSPSFFADGLGLLVGIVLVWFAAAAVLGVRGREPRRTPWHGLLLVAVAGCLVMFLSANLLTLAMGSALIDLALIAMVVTSVRGDRVAWRLVVPGLVSTFLLFAGSVWMDAELGHASLLARNLSQEVLVLVGVAGLLRLVVYPLYPRGIEAPESAATSVLPVGAGVYILARVQGLSPVLADSPWVLAVAGVALLAGGLLAWAGGARPGAQPRASEDAYMRVWSGAAVYLTGCAVASVVLKTATVVWPMLTFALALGTLAIWAEGGFDERAGQESGGPLWLGRRLGSKWVKGRSCLQARLHFTERWRSSWLGRYRRALLPALALAAVVGLPLTVGARGRWSFYGNLIFSGEAALLIAAMVADALLMAGLWSALQTVLKRAVSRRNTLASLLSMVALVVPLIFLAISPGWLLGSLELESTTSADVSVWGLGLVYVLPWLLGGWLVYVRSRSEPLMAPLHRVVGLGWFFRTADWLGQRFVTGVHWVGLVGEGEGWWGWALIILALGAIILTVP